MAALAASGWLADAGLVAVLPWLSALYLWAEIAVLPRYERAVSLRPLARLWTRATAVLFVLAVADQLTAVDLRRALVGLTAVLAVPLVGRVSQRLARQPRSTLLVGDRVAVSHLIAQWGPRPEVRIVGVGLTEADDDADAMPSQILGFPVVGGLDDVADLASAHRLDQVVVAPGPVVTAYDVRRLSWALESSRTELAVAAEVHGAVPRRIEPRLLGRRLLLSVQPTRRPALSAVVKAAFDRAVAGLMLVLTAPLLALLLLAIRVESPGSALFRQVRAGQQGRPFEMFKLRTMVRDAEARRHELEGLNEGSGPLFKLTRDPRVTRVGQLLRRTSLDELPQLWNVLRGQMSLVGPRPALPRETDEYDDWIRRRLSVKPGMTGLWQVSGRSHLSWTESVRLDLDYVDNWTLRGDLSIAGRTVNAVLRRHGAS